MMEILMEWRIWSKAALWMRKQQEMATLLAQAGAQLVQASAHEVYRGRTENASRRVAQNASGKILNLLCCSTAAKAFGSWLQNVLLSRHQRSVSTLKVKGKAATQ